jgi:hypothetical protein
MKPRIQGAMKPGIQCVRQQRPARRPAAASGQASGRGPVVMINMKLAGIEHQHHERSIHPV